MAAGSSYNLVWGGFNAGSSMAALQTTTDSTTAFSIQNSTGQALLTADTQNMKLTVQALVVNVTLTVNGHIITGNSSGSTTATVNANAGSGASCSVSGNDTGGQITLTTGTVGWAAGEQCKLVFATAFGSAPHPVITSANGTDTSAVKVYVDADTGNLYLKFIAADTAQNTYKFNYFNAQ